MKPKIIVGMVIIVGALVVLITTGFNDSAVYYMTVSELKAQPQSNQRGLRVSGIVDTSSIDWDAENIELSFNLVEKADTLHLFYSGLLPDQLREAQQVVAEGRLRQDGVFEANKLLLKCPSKYEAKSN